MFNTVSNEGASKPSSACKFVLVTGGVISGVGKGIIASSTGVLLQSLGERVTSIKIDPYLNIDAGTLSPYDHGEVFILGDGGEVDLDLGNYERFLNVTLTRDHNITTGKIYRDVIEKERRGDYLGKTVQVIPHITNHIQDWIERVSKIPVDASGLPPTTCVIELGGTVGDIESAPFVEALRQFQFRVGLENFMLIHVSLVPVVGSVGEQKTKPTQNSVRDLRSSGLTPDVVACRSTGPLEAAIVDKIAMFTHVPLSCVYSVHDCASVYHVPMLLEQQGLRKLLAQRLQLQCCGGMKASEAAAAASSHSIRRLQLSPDRPRKANVQVQDGTTVGAAREENEESYTREYRRWKQLAGNLLTAASTTRLTVAIVGKYTYLEDSYISVAKALAHAAMAQCVDCKVLWIEASDLEEPVEGKEVGQEGQADATGHMPPPPPAAPAAGAAGTGTIPLTAAEKHAAAWSKLRSAAGVIVPGGFGVRGTEGKIAALRYCREQKVPLLGICLGFQLAVVEHARNLLGMEGANSTEMAPDTAYPVVVFMPEGSRTHMGGTMRLGARESYFVQGTTVENSHARRLYTAAKVASDSAGNVGSKSPVQAEDLAAAAVDCIVERHRHRYEVNPELVPQLETHGMRFVARDAPGAAGERMEILERSDHPYFLAVQYHPEFLSRLIHPSPPFSGLVDAAVTHAAAAASTA